MRGSPAAELACAIGGVGRGEEIKPLWAPDFNTAIDDARIIWRGLLLVILVNNSWRESERPQFTNIER